MRRLVSRTWRRLNGLQWTGGEQARHRSAPIEQDSWPPLPQDFSAGRYLEINPDLTAAAETPAQAEEHYRRYGMAEGRSYKLDEDHLGQLPADFDADGYLLNNPDLENLRGRPIAAKAHYLASGRQEGRSYKLGDEDRFGQMPADFNADVYLDGNPDLEHLREHPIAAEAHYLASGRQEGRSYKFAGSSEHMRRPSILKQSPAACWCDLFKPGDFLALYPDLADGATTTKTLLAAFQSHGIDAIAALSLDHRFDPNFYAELFPETAVLTLPERYREWLESGIPAGRPGSEEEAVRNLLGFSAYPDSFDWQLYASRLDPAASTWPRVSVLEHLLTIGLPHGDEVPVVGDSSGPFLLALSDRLWTSKQPMLALDVLRQAMNLVPEDAELHHSMALRCIELDRRGEAERHEHRALALGDTSIWVYANLAELASLRSDSAESYRLLEVSRRHCEGFAPWRTALHNAAEADYAATATRAWDLYRAGNRSEADATLTEGLERITSRLSALDDLPAHIGPTAAGHVVLFANHGLPQCRHYRIEQRCRQFDQLAIPYRIFQSDQANQAREALVGARALIVYREPAFPATIRLLLHAHSMGMPTYYDIDDLIFDAAHYPDDFDTFEKQISFDNYLGLLYGTPLVRFAISLCDAGIASTTALSHHVAPLTRSGRCHVVPNGLDDRNDRFLRALTLQQKGGELVILYGSGSQAHNRNFNETVGPALLDVMAAHPHVILAVAGYLDLDPAFDTYVHRIRRFAFSQDLQAYWALLSEVDINLAVLTPGAMNDGKSEIKWLEAAVSGVPSVVSASARYREVIRDGVDGLLAESPDAWRTALFRLVEDGELRRRIGNRARERARVDYSLDTTAARLAAALGVMPSVPSRSRLRVLVVHVLFPPQSSGGATRVVRNNVDDLLDHYGDDIELAIFTTDFDAPVPSSADRGEAVEASEPESAAAPIRRSSRVGHYRNVPVFRVSRGTDLEITYRDEIMGRSFAAVLSSWKPQIVHFHCVQFLTGSVVEACAAAGIPYLITLHDAWWISPNQFLIDENNLLETPGSRALNDGAATMAAIDRKRFLGDQLAGAAALLAVSDSFAEIYQQAGFPQTRAVSNGLSSLFLKAPDRGPDRPGERIRIGHIGGLSRHKGSHLLRLALKGERFNRLDVVLVDHTMMPDGRRQETWGTTPVTIRGPADQDGVLALYADLDVLIAPSIWPESYGLVTREALAVGLWVVASNRGALGEDIVERENGFRIDVRDASDLARVLHLIDADPSRFRTPPPRRVTPRLSSAQADDLVAVYRDMALPRPAT